MGLFPPNMLLKAPRSRDFFDLPSGLCKGATECDSENRRHIRRMKRLEVRAKHSRGARERERQKERGGVEGDRERERESDGETERERER